MENIFNIIDKIFNKDLRFHYYNIFLSSYIGFMIGCIIMYILMRKTNQNEKEQVLIVNKSKDNKNEKQIREVRSVSKEKIEETPFSNNSKNTYKIKQVNTEKFQKQSESKKSLEIPTPVEKNLEDEGWQVVGKKKKI